MSDKSPREHTRRSDPENKHLPPSVRWINRAKALATGMPAIIALLAALGFTNSDKIKAAFDSPLEPVDGAPAEIVSGGLQQQVDAAIRNVNARLVALKAENEDLRAKDAQLQAQLQLQDSENYESLEAMIESTRAEIEQIRELVQ